MYSKPFSRLETMKSQPGALPRGDGMKHVRARPRHLGVYAGLAGKDDLMCDEKRISVFITEIQKLAVKIKAVENSTNCNQACLV